MNLTTELSVIPPVIILSWSPFVGEFFLLLINFCALFVIYLHRLLDYIMYKRYLLYIGFIVFMVFVEFCCFLFS